MRAERAAKANNVGGKRSVGSGNDRKLRKEK
jgi:hypothetical protein